MTIRAGYRRLIAATTATVALSAGGAVSVAHSGPAANAAASAPAAAATPAAASTNPLAGVRWGVYTDPNNAVVKAYHDAAGTAHTLLGKIALRPTMRWFGIFNAYGALTKMVRTYLRYNNGGDPNVLTQMAVFIADPWEGNTCTSVPSASELAATRAWVTRFAAAVGSARTAIVLQPDLPLALRCPGKTASNVRLVGFAAKTLSALPRTTVYLDAGAADWAKIPDLVNLLPRAGLRHVRGFALNASHTDATSSQIVYGAQLAKALAARGYPNRHFIVNTSSNGKPFTYPYYKQHYAAKYGGPPACTRRTQTHCVALGIPPTADVASTRWRLGGTVRSLAARFCDGYMWVGRAWIYHHVFDYQRALDVAATTPW